MILNKKKTKDSYDKIIKDIEKIIKKETTRLEKEAARLEKEKEKEAAIIGAAERKRQSEIAEAERRQQAEIAEAERKRQAEIAEAERRQQAEIAEAERRRLEAERNRQAEIEQLEAKKLELIEAERKQLERAAAVAVSVNPSPLQLIQECVVKTLEEYKPIILSGNDSLVSYFNVDGYRIPKELQYKSNEIKNDLKHTLLIILSIFSVFTKCLADLKIALCVLKGSTALCEYFPIETIDLDFALIPHPESKYNYDLFKSLSELICRIVCDFINTNLVRLNEKYGRTLNTSASNQLIEGKHTTQKLTFQFQDLIIPPLNPSIPPLISSIPPLSVVDIYYYDPSNSCINGKLFSSIEEKLLGDIGVILYPKLENIVEEKMYYCLEYFWDFINATTLSNDYMYLKIYLHTRIPDIIKDIEKKIEKNENVDFEKQELKKKIDDVSTYLENIFKASNFMSTDNGRFMFKIIGQIKKVLKYKYKTEGEKLQYLFQVFEGIVGCSDRKGKFNNSSISNISDENIKMQLFTLLPVIKKMLEPDVPRLSHSEYMPPSSLGFTQPVFQQPPLFYQPPPFYEMPPNLTKRYPNSVGQLIGPNPNIYGIFYRTNMQPVIITKDGHISKTNNPDTDFYLAYDSQINKLLRINMKNPTNITPFLKELSGGTKKRIHNRKGKYTKKINNKYKK